jgi:type IV secretion system protein VirD4
LINTSKIKQFVLPNVPYAFIFWLFDKSGEAYRLSPGHDILQKLLGTVANLNMAFQKPMLSFAPFDLLIGLIGAATIYGVVYYKKKNAKKWKKDVLCYKGCQWTTPTKHRRFQRFRHKVFKCFRRILTCREVLYFVGFIKSMCFDVCCHC